MWEKFQKIKTKQHKHCRSIIYSELIVNNFQIHSFFQ